MDQPLTYQQLIAEQFSENKYNTHYEDTSDDSDIEEFENNMKTYYEPKGATSIDEEEYRKFAGNRNTAELLTNAKEFVDNGKTSIRYNKDVIKRTFNIDSRFRAYNSIPPSATSFNSYINAIDTNVKSKANHFLFRTKEVIKNAISVKLASLEIPNRFYNLFNYRGNTSFEIREHLGYDDDPYTKVEVELDSNGGAYYSHMTIITAVEKALNKYRNVFQVSKNLEDRLIIKNTDGKEYDFFFADEVVFPQVFFTLPEALGFQNVNYRTVNGEIRAEDLIDMNADSYIYLQINDWSTIIPQTTNDTFFTVFAKIPVTINKGQMIFDTEQSNPIPRTYYFLQPTNVSLLDIKLLDRLGNLLQLDTHINYSMTLEIEEVVNQSLYEKLREM